MQQGHGCLQSVQPALREPHTEVQVEGAEGGCESGEAGKARIRYSVAVAEAQTLKGSAEAQDLWRMGRPQEQGQG
jgi:hypothetical protein